MFGFFVETTGRNHTVTGVESRTRTSESACYRQAGKLPVTVVSTVALIVLNRMRLTGLAAVRRRS